MNLIAGKINTYIREEGVEEEVEVEKEMSCLL